ncbi:MAG: S24/S26 family peptidase [Acidobacteriota bacterium]
MQDLINTTLQVGSITGNKVKKKINIDSAMDDKPTKNTGKNSELIISGKDMILLIQDITEKGKKFRFKAEGFSMSPFIRNNDVLTISPIKKKLHIGDVVAVKRSNNKKLAIHRIVGRKKGLFLIKGDNTGNSFDGYSDSKDIIGIVTEIKRGEKKIRSNITPLNYMIAIMSRKNMLPVIRKVKNKLRLQGTGNRRQ